MLGRSTCRPNDTWNFGIFQNFVTARPINLKTVQPIFSLWTGRSSETEIEMQYRKLSTKRLAI